MEHSILTKIISEKATVCLWVMTELDATIGGKKGINVDIPVVPKYTV